MISVTMTNVIAGSKIPSVEVYKYKDQINVFRDLNLCPLNGGVLCPKGQVPV